MPSKIAKEWIEKLSTDEYENMVDNSVVVYGVGFEKLPPSTEAFGVSTTGTYYYKVESDITDLLMEVYRYLSGISDSQPEFVAKFVKNKQWLQDNEKEFYNALAQIFNGIISE